MQTPGSSPQNLWRRAPARRRRACTALSTLERCGGVFGDEAGQGRSGQQPPKPRLAKLAVLPPAGAFPEEVGDSPRGHPFQRRISETGGVESGLKRKCAGSLIDHHGARDIDIEVVRVALSVVLAAPCIRHETVDEIREEAALRIAGIRINRRGAVAL